MLQPLNAYGPHAFVQDYTKFNAALELLREALHPLAAASILSMDDSITWMRSYSFLRDDRFVAMLNDPLVTNRRKSCIWRTYIAVNLAALAVSSQGDFIEAGCLDGFTASKIDEFVALQDKGKRYNLYDLFEWKPGDQHKDKPGLQSGQLYEEVKLRFSSKQYVHIHKGDIRSTLTATLPEVLAFVHIDLNHAESELFVLESVSEKMTKGGIILLDDYGWLNFSETKIALDSLIKDKNMPTPIELPTGQAFMLFQE